MTEPYHNKKMVTVNETAYKSVKKTLTTKIVNIRARTLRARHYKRVHMKYMSYNHINFLSITFKRINIFIIDIRINYKHFHSKNMTREEKRDDYEKEPKFRGATA